MSALREIYLDHNATTPLAPEVLEAMLPWLQEGFGNPSCAHRMGQEARAAIDRARRSLSEFFGCARDEVVFTGSGTEANNLAIKGAALARAERGKHILVGATEHPAVMEPVRWLARSHGFEVEEIPADATGQIHPEALARRVRSDTVLVSIMTAQNVVGTVNRMEELAEVLAGRGAVFHTDAAQAVGKIPCAFSFLGVDLLTVAGHKLYGPKGVGALIVRRGLELEPVLHGAGHESGRRPGTENTAGIAGLAAAIDMARRHMASSGERMVALRDALHVMLAGSLPGVVLNGHPLDRLPNTLNLSFLGVRGKDLAARVPELLLSTGPACMDTTDALPPTFSAMGIDSARASSSLRISLGRGNTLDEIERTAELLIPAVQALRAEAGSLDPQALEESAPPGCPRCERAPLRLQEIQSFPAVVCAEGCRYEAFLVPPPNVT
jgi:cysteine desulfurase